MTRLPVKLAFLLVGTLALAGCRTITYEEPPPPPQDDDAWGDDDAAGDDDGADDDAADDDAGDDDLGDDDVSDDDAGDDDLSDDDVSDDDTGDDDLGDDDIGGNPYGPPNSWFHADEADVPPGLSGTGWSNGAIAHDFTLIDQHGDQVELYQFYGTVIVLDLFTYW